MDKLRLKKLIHGHVPKSTIRKSYIYNLQCISKIQNLLPQIWPEYHQ